MGRSGESRRRIPHKSGQPVHGHRCSPCGRITSFLVDGRNFLTDDKVDSLNWGSTFWPSPQSDWDWPPPAAIDNEPYTVTLEGPGPKQEVQGLKQEVQGLKQEVSGLKQERPGLKMVSKRARQDWSLPSDLR